MSRSRWGPTGASDPLEPALAPDMAPLLKTVYSFV